MATRAYDDLYLSGAQNVLGHAVDFAVMTLEIDPDTFGNAFAVSSVSKQFAIGNPAYVAGKNGCELAREVLTEVCISFPDAEDAMYPDRSPEYWAGWSLAFYQWYRDVPFAEILQAVPLSGIINMYPLYHEMDISRFAEQMDTMMKKAYPQTRLRRHRDICGMSQAALAEESGVPLRQIQLFEQGQRDINKTSADTLKRLSKALCCRMEDLIEPDYPDYERL